MTRPIDIDQIRRQFPTEIKEYLDAIVQDKFDDIEQHIDDINDELDRVDQYIDEAAERAAEAAEARFEALTFEQFLALLQPEIDEYISE